MGEFVVGLHPRQARIYNSPARFKVCAAGRRFGKSHYAANVLGIEALRTENDLGYKLTEESGVYYVAPTFDQAKRIMWPKLKELLGYEAQGGLIAGENSNEGWFRLINGRKIHIKGADNPDSLRGIGLSFVVLDEYADMRPEVWTHVLENALADYEGGALFIGTPKGKNHFYTLFTRAMEYDFEASGDPYPMYEAFHFKSLDNPFLARRELDRLMNDETKSREVIRQELEADFVAGGGTVLKPTWFEVIDALPEAAVRRDGRGNHVVSSSEGLGSYYVTVDLAGFSAAGSHYTRSDETVICTTHCTEDAWYVMDMQHGHWDVREVALRIIRTCDTIPGCRLGIEKGALMNAIGPYLEDEMRRYHRYITPEPLSHNNQRKIDRIVSALQGRAERGRIKLLDDQAAMSKAARRGEPWNQWFLDQCADFPSKLSHDDGPDALAYVDQMQSVGYFREYEYEEWDVMDVDAGY